MKIKVSQIGSYDILLKSNFDADSESQKKRSLKTNIPADFGHFWLILAKRPIMDEN